MNWESVCLIDIGGMYVGSGVRRRRGFRGAQTPQPLEQRDLCEGGTLQYALYFRTSDPNRSRSNHTT